MAGFWARPVTAMKGVIPTGFASADRSAGGGASHPATVVGTHFDVHVSRAHPPTVVISLIGDHDDAAAGMLARIAQAEVGHCDRLVVDFSRTEGLDTEVVTTLVDIALLARTNGIRLQVVTRHGTFAHDLLDTFGILARLDCTDRLPDLQP